MYIYIYTHNTYTYIYPHRARTFFLAQLGDSEWMDQGFPGFGLSIVRIRYLVSQMLFVLLLVVWRLCESRDVKTVPPNSILGIS